MYEGLAKAFSNEIQTLSGGKLQCIPYSRALLDFFEARGKPAQPLVARAVVFRNQNHIDWFDLLKLIPGIPNRLFKEATQSPNANGMIRLQIPQIDTSSQKSFKLPYRIIGFPHGTAELGSYHVDGTWNGHIVVCVDETLIDLTIGQLNDSRLSIDFTPPWVTIETDPGFLSGRNGLVGVQDGMLVIYWAYPDERTYEDSNSWGTNPEFLSQLKYFGSQFAETLQSLSDRELEAKELELP
ncbi:hypothetical protein Pan153_47070 [Gimesia panareensis]|uniref:Uncharacterized protein n=1 Tax=Gimesia panareensis TaxID=2527978 RepID=A0A518FUM4_9PLAN|nr:hypothetical protein [Gimesia panareensis]QDV20038.1 hypothetical protein Pan153_47070 [Gimesia panareensis]